MFKTWDSLSRWPGLFLLISRHKLKQQAGGKSKYPTQRKERVGTIALAHIQAITMVYTAFAGLGLGNNVAAVRLLKRLLSWSPSNRPTAAQALAHAYFQEVTGALRFWARAADWH